MKLFLFVFSILLSLYMYFFAFHVHAQSPLPNPTQPIEEVNILKEYAKIIKKDGSLLIISSEDTVYEMTTTGNTVIEDETGQVIEFKDIQTGDTVNVVFTQGNVALSITKLNTLTDQRTDQNNVSDVGGIFGIIDTLSDWIIGIVIVLAVIGGLGLILVKTGGWTKIKNQISTDNSSNNEEKRENNLNNQEG